MGGGEVYVYPTLKGLKTEGEQVEEAYGLIKPAVVCVSLSDRELAEVRYALSDQGEGMDGDYVPESKTMRRVLGVEEEDVEEGDDGEDEDDDDIPDELDMPAGVVSRKEVEEAMDEPFAPDLMAADSAALGDKIFISDTDMAYSRKLATFGDVELPPPSFMEAVRAADRDDVPVVDMDLSEDEYTRVFCDNVSYWQMVSHSRKVRRLRKRLRAQTPEEMMEGWDDGLRKIKGFDTLEQERERKMAAELATQLERHGKVLAVIDMVRVDGTLEELTRLSKG